MRAKRYGKIVNFCSVTLTGYAPYIASKGAMLGPHGVRVDAVSPGAVVSDAEARVFGDRAEAYAAWAVERRWLKTRILPDAVLFLVSPWSDMITGQEIRVDGGW